MRGVRLEEALSRPAAGGFIYSSDWDHLDFAYEAEQHYVRVY